MDDLLRLMKQATLSPGAHRVDSKFAPTERSKDQITYEVRIQSHQALRA